VVLHHPVPRIVGLVGLVPRDAVGDGGDRGGSEGHRDERVAPASLTRHPPAHGRCMARGTRSDATPMVRLAVVSSFV
jgi:hypothetical protein